MPKRLQQKKGGKAKEAKNKAKAKAKSLVGKVLNGKNDTSNSSSSLFVENVQPSSPPPPPPRIQSSYPPTFFNDNLSVQPLYPSASVTSPSSHPHPRRFSSSSASVAARSVSIGRLMQDDPSSRDYEEDEGYQGDWRSDMGDDFYAGPSEGGEEEEASVDDRQLHPSDRLPINRYDGLVYVTDGSPPPRSLSSRSSSTSSSISSDDDEDEADRMARRQAMGQSSTSWDDSPATSTSQQLYSPPPKPTTSVVPEYRYAPVSSTIAHTESTYDPTLPPSFHYDPHHHHHHHLQYYDSYPSHLAQTYLHSAVASPALSRVNSSHSVATTSSESGSSTPRGRSAHPRLLWRSVLSQEVIHALDDHHQKIAGCPLPRIDSSSSASSPSRSELTMNIDGGGTSRFDVGEEREAPGKLDVEVRERDKERERSRMNGRKALSREGRRWSKAVERWGL